ncbi:MAG: GFA family protein, partial [Pseudomonadota bacterium]
PLRSIVGCHCRQCRQLSGHFVAATAVDRTQLSFLCQDGLAWYDSSPGAQRGFCRHCGANLFFSGHGLAHISVHAGSLEGDLGVKLDRHIYTAEKGDYYHLHKDLPHFPGPD